MYELNINAGVTGVEQLDRLGAATEKQTERTKRVDEAIKNYTASNDKLAIKLLEVEKNEVRLEQLREQHRMQTERLAAAVDKQAGSQDRLNSATRRSITDVQAASGAIRAFEGNLPIRAVEQFTTKMLGMGGTFQAIFPIVGAIAMVEVLTKGAEKLGLQVDFWNDITRLQKESTKNLREAGDEYAKLLGQLKEIQKQERRRAFIARDPKNGGMNADVAEAGDTQDLAASTSRVNQLRGQRDSLQRLSGLQQVRTEDTFARLNAEQPGRVQPGDLMQADLLGVDTVEQAKIRLRDITATLRAAEQEQFNLRQQMASATAKVDDDIAKKREEAARKVAAIEEHILSLRMKTEEVSARAFFGNSLEGKGAYEQVKLRIEESREVAKYPSRANEIHGLYTVLRSASYGGNSDAIAKRNMDEGFALDDVSQSSMAKLIRTDLASERRDSPELRALISPARPAVPSDYRSPGQELRDVRNSEGRYMSLARVSAQLSGQSERDQVEGLYAKRLQFADQELHALLREADAKNDLIAREDALDQAQQKRYDAALEREKAILELVLKQKQEFEKNFVGLIHALTSGHLGDFVLKRLESLGDEVLAKLGGKLFDVILRRAGSGTISVRDAIGGAAKDPADVQATNDNTVATDDNTRALRDLTSVLLTGGGGASGTIGFPNGSGGPGVMGGSSSTIMYGVPPSGGSGGGGSSAFGTIARYGAAAGIGYKGISDISRGGGKNVAGGVGEVAMAAAIVDQEPVSKAILAGVALAAIAVSSLLPDPKAERARNIANTLNFSRFTDPVSINASMTTQGGYADYDRFGGIRGSDFAAFPQIDQPYIDHFHNVTVPGRTGSQFGSGAAPVNVHVYALDAKSVIDRHQDIGDAVVRAIDAGHTNLQEKLRSF